VVSLIGKRSPVPAGVDPTGAREDADLVRVHSCFLVIATGVAIALPGCVSADDDPLPARLTLDGLAGVSYFDAPSRIRAAWELPIPLVQTASGSSEIDIGTVCAGDQRGLLFFLGGYLEEMRFYRGTLTDRGVGNGSTLADLRRAYGPRLEHVETWGGLAITIATFRVTSTGGPPRPSIDFDLDRTGRVWVVRYGLRERRDLGYEAYGAGC
jgi:hypothetical protein